MFYCKVRKFIHHIKYLILSIAIDNVLIIRIIQRYYAFTKMVNDTLVVANARSVVYL